MAVTWAVCPQCQLKHSARPDGLCPRCKQPVGAATGGAPPIAPELVRPGAGASEPPLLTSLSGPPIVEAEVNGAARIAGGVLIVNALSVGAERLIASATSASPSSPVAYLIDAVLGVLLLAGKAKALPWAKVRAGLALVVLPALLFFNGSPGMAALQVVYCGGLLGLLLGTPGTLRTVVATIGIGICFSLEAVGLYSMATGVSLVARGDVEPDVVAQVEGRAFPYRLTAPNDRWRLRTAEAARKDNPLSDRWLVRPDQDAHLIVIAEAVPGSGAIDMDAFADAVLQNSQKTWQEFKILDEETLSTQLEAGRILHTQGVIKGLAIEGYHGLFIQGRSIFQVWGFVEKGKFPLVREDLTKLISSFELTAS